jgi:manganese/zinc/iron transport system permease protein
MSDELWVIATALLTSLACALVGVFLVLRRLAMLADAISHSILFGIVVAFLWAGSRALLPMLVGATLTGLLTAWLTQLLTRQGRLQEDASIGVTFTWLFALGVILISAFAGQVDLDQDCVLYGELAFVAFESLSVAGIEIAPRAFCSALLVLVLNLLVLGLGFRRLTLVSFDSVFAEVQGVRVGVWHYALMTLVSLTTVASFEAVGAILVVAMLVIPANTAFLIAKSVRAMVVYALLFATSASLGGYALARWLDAPIAASIVLLAAGQLVVVLLGVQVLQRATIGSTAKGMLESQNQAL